MEIISSRQENDILSYSASTWHGQTLHYGGKESVDVQKLNSNEF